MIDFFRPQNISDVNQLLAEKGDETKIIAGGTDLLVEARLKEDLMSGTLCDISGIDEIRQINVHQAEVEIGAAVTHDQIVQSDIVNKFAPVLSQACHQIGSQQIRNRGTIGGNICNASPCADSIPALFILDARLVVNSIAGERDIKISDFFVSPYHTVLKTGEWISKIRCAKLNKHQHSAFIKLGRRNALAISRMNMAAVLEINNGMIEFSKFVPGSVFPVWQPVTEVEELLKGAKVSNKLFEEAGELTARKMIETSGRRWSTPYKEPVVAALTSRVLCKSAGIDFPELTVNYFD